MTLPETISPDRPAHVARFYDLVWGVIPMQCLYVVAKLGVADRLVDGPRQLLDVAREVGADADALWRVVRALVPLDVFTHPAPDSIGLGPLGELLVDERAGSLRYLPIFWGEEVFRAWGDALHSVRTGEPAFDHVFGATHWEWLSSRPEKARTFDRAMSGGSSNRTPPVLARDWAGVRAVVDVGGGNGSVLRALLAQEPGLVGTLFDLPHVVEAAAAVIEADGLASRCRTVGGSFFEAIPTGADVYLLAQILHDWSDDDALRILTRVHEAMPAHGRLLVVELIVPDGDEPHLSKLLDLQMLVLLGGRERTLGDWRHLLAGGGFELGDISHGPRSSVIEARPVAAT
jgi:hypothetical protein